VPQPEHHPPPARNTGPDSGGGGSPRSPNSGSGPSNPPGPGTNRGPEPGGLFQSIFGGLTSHLGHHNQNTRNSPSTGNGSETRSPTSSNLHAQTQHRRSNSDPASRRSSSSPPSNERQTHNSGNSNVPGSWSDDLD
jgi:hypothetical protein